MPGPGGLGAKVCQAGWVTGARRASPANERPVLRVRLDGLEQRLSEVIDRIKTSLKEAPVLLVCVLHASRDRHKPVARTHECPGAIRPDLFRNPRNGQTCHIHAKG